LAPSSAPGRDGSTSANGGSSPSAPAGTQDDAVSGGAVAAIVIGAAVGLAVLVALLLYLLPECRHYICVTCCCVSPVGPEEAHLSPTHLDRSDERGRRAHVQLTGSSRI